MILFANRETRRGAEFLNAKDLGTRQAGKWTDLIVLASNPLDDIKNTRTMTGACVAGNKVTDVPQPEATWPPAARRRFSRYPSQ